MKLEKCSVPRVYTDIPTGISFPTYGASQTTAPCLVFTAWQTDLQHFPRGEGSLAIRWTRNGQRFFDSGRTQFVVDDNAYLVFNGGREFSSSVESNSTVSCYCIAFEAGLAEDALRAMVTPADRLLDDPFCRQFQPVQFFETAYRHDMTVTPILRRLEQADASGSETHGWFEEQFRLLAVRLLATHREVHRNIDRLSPVRAATRLEVYRRILVARDFMEASLDRPISVSDIASTACFSPFHFLRNFKQVLGETPHQFLTRRRIERAQDLLVQTDMSVTNICFAVGFESLGSFSTLFRRRTGSSPEGFRSLSRATAARSVVVRSPALLVEATSA